MAGFERLAGAAVRQIAKQTAGRVRTARAAHLRRRVEDVLARREPPDCTAAEHDFDSLQAAYPPLPEYGYDSASNWRRAAERGAQLVSETGLSADASCRMLDLCCGDGMLGPVMRSFGCAVELCDLEDWRDARARELPFAAVDLSRQCLPYGDRTFDVVCSFNSFEHIPDPATTFAEACRVCKPGGAVYLDFAPLYAGPWGLHAYRSLRMPYPQFLFGESFVAARLEQIGIWDLGQKRTTLQPLNQWTVAQFQRLWSDGAAFEVDQSLGPVTWFADLVLRYPQSFQGRGLTWTDLTTHGLHAVIRPRAIRPAAA